MKGSVWAARIAWPFSMYGGQVLAQSLIAAERTLPENRTVHSMHGYFLRPGDATQGITFAVDRIHDGRSFSTRRSQAYQNGVPIFSMIASFQDEDPGIEHAVPMPDGIPDPEEVASDDELIGSVHPITGRLLADLIARKKPQISAEGLDISRYGNSPEVAKHGQTAPAHQQ